MSHNGMASIKLITSCSSFIVLLGAWLIFYEEESKDKVF